MSICGRQSENSTSPQGPAAEYEVVHIAKTPNYCGLCDDYAQSQASKPVAVLCCEGGCLRGDVARQAANHLCHVLLPTQTVRICLGGAFTKDSGQRDLVRHAAKVLALEGCAVDCATRMMQGVVDTPISVICVDELYEFDRSLFGINELPEAEIKRHGISVATQIAESLQAK